MIEIPIPTSGLVAVHEHTGFLPHLAVEIFHTQLLPAICVAANANASQKKWRSGRISNGTSAAFATATISSRTLHSPGSTTMNRAGRVCAMVHGCCAAKVSPGLPVNGTAPFRHPDLFRFAGDLRHPYSIREQIECCRAFIQSVAKDEDEILQWRTAFHKIEIISAMRLAGRSGCILHSVSRRHGERLQKISS